VISYKSQPHLLKYFTAYSNTPARLKIFRKLGAGADDADGKLGLCDVLEAA
jgi:hypothetical protein